MARIYSAVLANSAPGTGTTSITLGTVPVGQVWVVRDVELNIPATMTGFIIIVVNRSANYPLARLDGAGTADVYGSFDRRVVLEAGDALTAQRNLTGSSNGHIYVSGYRLVALP